MTHTYFLGNLCKSSSYKEPNLLWDFQESDFAESFQEYDGLLDTAAFISALLLAPSYNMLFFTKLTQHH